MAGGGRKAVRIGFSGKALERMGNPKGLAVAANENGIYFFPVDDNEAFQFLKVWKVTKQAHGTAGAIQMQETTGRKSLAKFKGNYELIKENTQEGLECWAIRREDNDE